MPAFGWAPVINRVKESFDKETLKLLITSLVFGKMLYCSTVWSNTSMRFLAVLQASYKRATFRASLSIGVFFFLFLFFVYEFLFIYNLSSLIAELWRAKRACGAPWVSKSTHPRKFGNHVHRASDRPSAPQAYQ